MLKKCFKAVCFSWHLQVTRLTMNLCSEVHCSVTDCLSTYAWRLFKLYTRCSLTSLAVHQLKPLTATPNSSIISHPHRFLRGRQRRQAAIFDTKYLQVGIGRFVFFPHYSQAQSCSQWELQQKWTVFLTCMPTFQVDTGWALAWRYVTSLDQISSKK